MSNWIAFCAFLWIATLLLGISCTKGGRSVHAAAILSPLAFVPAIWLLGLTLFFWFPHCQVGQGYLNFFIWLLRIGLGALPIIHVGLVLYYKGLRFLLAAYGIFNIAGFALSGVILGVMVTCDFS
jgi:hypothetical protein